MFGVTTSVGVSDVRLPELDRVLTADGFAALPRRMFFGSFGVEGRLRTVRFTLPVEIGQISSRHAQNGETIDVRVVRVGPAVGFDLLRGPGSASFVMLGAGVGSLTVDVSPSLTLFAERAGFDPKNHVYRQFLEGTVELGHDRYFPLHARDETSQLALQVGGRVGYSKQLTTWSWRTSGRDSRQLPGGPDTDVSGPQVRLVLGLMLD